MMTKKQLLAFELEVGELWESGDLPFLVHLSGGNERPLIGIFRGIKRRDWVLSTHRSHYHWLLKGGGRKALIEKIKIGRSMFVFSRGLRFISTSILAGLSCVACGIALGIKMRAGKERVWCFVGDGAEDNGHFYEAVRFAESNDLPVHFVIEDNDASSGASKAERGAGCVISWPKARVTRYRYQALYPHAGNGTKKKIVFKPVVLAPK